MVKVIHAFEDSIIYKEIKDNLSFILSNKQGSYIFLSDKPSSIYQGMFNFDNLRMFRIIENIEIINSTPITEIKNNFFSIERKRNRLKEQFTLMDNLNSLFYELNLKKEIIITLDVKESYDGRIWGRNYNITNEKDCIIIRFTKKTDQREDNSNDSLEYKRYLAIKSEDNKFEKLENWKERTYDFDKKRNSKSYNRYVFDAIKLHGKSFIFTVSKNKDEAIKECMNVYKQKSKLKKKNEANFKKFISRFKVDKIQDKEKKFAYISSLNSINGLLLNKDKNPGILAGLPWFFQIWARDELISLRSLVLMKNFEASEKILKRQISFIQDDGSIYHKNNEGINSADSLGFLLKRIQELNDASNKYIKIDFIKLKNIIDNLVTKHTINNFAVSNLQETWMDSLTRKGIRIEIQAMRLFIYDSMYKLTKNKIYQYLETKLKRSVKEKFWSGNYLKDGINDDIIRPNIFIAYYFYPNLISKEEWITCFENSLKKLWLDWGGLSTIDKSSPSFIFEHTGEDSTSYHNGDSWYWINNLAALCLYNLDKERFKAPVKKIIEASTEEILWKGAISHHAELSSAKELSGQGCLMQAWSSALYIELMDMILRENNNNSLK